MKTKEIWKKFKNNNQTKELKTNNKSLKNINNFSTDKKSLIEVKNLSMIYNQNKKNEKVVFENINFNIYENEIVALLGGNGAGKTTLVEIITQIKKPTSGEVVFNYSSSNAQENVGVQFQDLSFPKGLTVKDFINFQIRLSQENVNEDFLFEILRTFKLDDLLKMKVSKLSGGQQQRLNVLIAMMSKPKVLFLDEFTTGLDIAIKNEIKEFILKYAKKNNITIVIVSHDIDIIDQMANHFILISDKQLKINTDKKTIVDEFGSVSKFLFNYIV